MATEQPERSFVGSFVDTPGEALVVVRGEVDANVADRIAAHLEGVVVGGARFVTVEATAVDRYHPNLLQVLGQAQHRLGARRGMLCVRGLAAGPAARPPFGAPPPTAGP